MKVNSAIVTGALLLLATSTLMAQAEKFQYRFSLDVGQAIEKDSVPWKYQVGASEYSFIGNYQKTRETWDKNGVGTPLISGADSLHFREFEPVDAREYLIGRSKQAQIIIINEAHTYPRHRIFVHSLLQGLYDNGYRHLGLEALFDTTLNERKFPILESGYYTREPAFGNLISAALDIGFVLFGYDDFKYNGKDREIAQARNIAGFMEKNPSAKVLILCGHDHVIEGTPNNRSWEKAMAGRLKEFTAINPFTVDQAQCLEKSDASYDHPFIAMAGKGFPVVLVGKDGALFNGKRDSDQFDATIIHPATTYVNHRPDWLLSLEGRRVYDVEPARIFQHPLLVLAYRENEFEKDGIPADIIEITEEGKIPSLILSPGSYDIILKNKEYEVVGRYEVHID